jgi:hypothetical protein
MDLIHARRELLDTTQQLLEEFDGEIAAGSVLRCVGRCRDELLLLGVRDGLGDAVRAMARHRLLDRVSADARLAHRLAG